MKQLLVSEIVVVCFQYSAHADHCDSEILNGTLDRLFIIPKHDQLFVCITLYLKLIYIFSLLIPRKPFQKYFLGHQMRLVLANQKSSIINNIQVFPFVCVCIGVSLSNTVCLQANALSFFFVCVCVSARSQAQKETPEKAF